MVSILARFGWLTQAENRRILARRPISDAKRHYLKVFFSRDTPISSEYDEVRNGFNHRQRPRQCSFEDFSTTQSGHWRGPLPAVAGRAALGRRADRNHLRAGAARRAILRARRRRRIDHREPRRYSLLEAFRNRPGNFGG